MGSRVITQFNDARLAGGTLLLAEQSGYLGEPGESWML